MQPWTQGSAHAVCPCCIAQLSDFVSANPICPPLPNHSATYTQGLCRVFVLLWLCSPGLLYPSHGAGWVTLDASACLPPCAAHNPQLPGFGVQPTGSRPFLHGKWLEPIVCGTWQVCGLQEVPNSANVKWEVSRAHGEDRDGGRRRAQARRRTGRVLLLCRKRWLTCLPLIPSSSG